MSISFSCQKCGKQYETPDETAGKTARCKQCGNQFTIPRPAKAPTADLYDLDEPLPPPRQPYSPGGQSAPKRKSSRTSAKSEGSGAGKTAGAVFGVIFVILMVGLRVARIYNRVQRANNPQPTFQGANGQPRISPALAVDRNGPIAVPPLPEPGPGREIMPGVVLHEIRLPGGTKPGFSGKLWLYLPPGDHAAKSLPCVLIAGAGSNLLTGMDLGDGDRPEHIPYVRTGFAVLAFELDGAVHGKPPSIAELDIAVPKFLAARAGMVNAHIALEYILAKVPQVDPGKVFAVGHSSAGTLAMLFAEHEPRLKGCVAFAPAIDLEKRFGAGSVQKLQQAGIGDLATRYAPKNNESKLSVPLLLFHARDDSNLPYVDTEASAKRLEQMGKAVSLILVASGDHYESMIREGIPSAITWMRQQAGLEPLSASDLASATASSAPHRGALPSAGVPVPGFRPPQARPMPPQLRPIPQPQRPNPMRIQPRGPRMIPNRRPMRP